MKAEAVLKKQTVLYRKHDVHEPYFFTHLQDTVIAFMVIFHEASDV